MTDDTFRLIVAAGVGIATLSIVVMAVVTIILYRVLARMESRVGGLVDTTKPMVESVYRVVNVNSPKIGRIVTSAEETAANARDISEVAKDQAHRFGEVGRDIADRAKIQVARVDAVVDETVEQAQHMGANVRSAVSKPLTEFSGVVAGIRAGVSAYAQGRRPNVSRVTQDEEMFI
jgi:methyl-accepting chemotaxis protein